MADAPDSRWIAGADVLERLVRLAPESPDSDGVDAVELVRDGAALLLRRGDVLVRVRGGDGLAVAEREVHLAAVLEDVGVPVTRLVGRASQPWFVEDCIVTGWRWSEGPGPIRPADLGTLARVLRERTPNAVLGVPVLDPVEAVLGVVAHLPIDDEEAAFVRFRAIELAGPWADAADDDPLGRAIVHGDLHSGNVVPGPDGPLLTDLELSGAGPSSYDAAPAVVAVERYGADPADLHEFLDAFGADPRSWSGFATFVALYELWVTAWAVGVRHQDPSWADEASTRVATLRDGVDVRWKLR